MDQNILEKYALAIKDAEDILNGKIEPDIRKGWSKEERQRWLVREPKCPLCKQKYSDANSITKEHIHPLCIGGKESAHNITALCDKCNTSRNEMMYSVLAFKNVSDLKKRWPANKTSVQEFVIWCHATIFEDISVILEFSHINESFSIARNIDYPEEFEESEFDGVDKKRVVFGESVKSAAKSFFGAFKLPKTGTLNNSSEDKGYGKRVVSCRNCSQKLRIPNDYEGDYRCPTCKSINNNENIADSKTRGANASLSIEKFEEIVLQLLPAKQILLTSLALKVNAYMKSNNFGEQNTTAFLKLFGLPRGFKKALETHLERKVRIFTTLDGKVMIENRSSLIPENSTKLIKQINEVTPDEEVAIMANEKVKKMYLEILTKDISHVLYSTLSHKEKFESSALGGQINARLRKEGLIQEDELFYSLYGLSKKKGLIKLIISEFAEQITCFTSNGSQWYVELKASAHLLALKDILERMGAENNGVVKMIDFWVALGHYREENGISTGDFKRQLGIPVKGPIHEQMWRFIERLNVPYSFEGFMIEGQTANIILS